MPWMSYRFANRSQAGQFLARKLEPYAGQSGIVVLALPRGGVPVAFEVAQRLGAPLDVFLVRKLGVPSHEELAMGAIASGGICFLNQDVVESLRISSDVVERVMKQEREELRRRERDYRHGEAPELRGRTVILVDDGLATGASMRAAIMALRQQRLLRLIAAVPVGARETVQELKAHVDEMVCVHEPEKFSSVGEWYEDFAQIEDDEVREFLLRPRNSARGVSTRALSP